MNNEPYKSILYNSPTGYAYYKAIFNAQGKAYDYEFIDVNQAFEALTSLNAAWIIGKRASQVLPVIYQGAFDWMAFHADLVAKGDKREFSFFAEPLSTWFRVTAYSPQENHFIIFFSDISREIQQIKEFDTFFMVTPDLLCVLDQEGNFIKTNTAWERVLGVKSDKLAKGHFLDFIHPGDGQFTGEILAALIVHDSEATFVNRLYAKNDVCRYFEWRCHAHGKRIYMAARDITDKVEEQRITDKLVRYSEEFLQMTAEELDYQKLTNYLLELSQARYATFSLYNPRTGKFETTVIAGDSQPPERLSDLLGFNPLGHEWVHDPEQTKKTGTDTMVTFPNLREMSGGFLSEIALSHLEKDFPTGEGVLVKILKDGAMIGEFSLLMPQGKAFKNRGAVEIFTRQAGLLLARIQAEKEASNQKAYFQALFLNTTDAMLYFDYQANVYKVNEQFTEMFGYTMEDLEGVNVNTLFQLGKPPLETITQRILQGERVIMETLRYTKSGKGIPVSIKGGPVYIDGEIKGGYAVYTDISERKAYEEHLKHLSLHDQLTGLYNRHFFETRIKIIEKNKSYPISVIAFDVDWLKLVNDTLGHDQGDQLLQLVADLISHSLRGNDMLARVGGDEFVAVLPETDEETAAKIAGRIRGNIDQANQAKRPFLVSVSIGVATALNQETPLRETLKKADERMYHEKLVERKSSRGEMIAVLLDALAELKQ